MAVIYRQAIIGALSDRDEGLLEVWEQHVKRCLSEGAGSLESFIPPSAIVIRDGPDGLPLDQSEITFEVSRQLEDRITTAGWRISYLNNPFRMVLS